MGEGKGKRMEMVDRIEGIWKKGEVNVMLPSHYLQAFTIIHSTVEQFI